MDVDIFFAGP
jgi:hypothetical protein